jgi:hypothetical protein
MIEILTVKTNVKEKNQKARIYFHPKGEAVMENFVNRHSRPHLEYKTMLPVVFDRLKQQHGLDFIGAQAHWNVKAGCAMCPCSPGFVADAVFTDNEGNPIDIYVTYTVRATKN